MSDFKIIYRFQVLFLVSFFCFGILIADDNQSPLTPPIAKIKLKTDKAHGDVRLDPYFWLRDKSNPEVIEYLSAENEYAEKIMASTTTVQQKLFQEMKSRIQETDISVPYKKGEYFYYFRDEEGKSYKIACRKKGNLNSEEEILLDINKLAKGHEYFDLGAFSISYNHKLLAFSYDTDGSERYILKIKNLTNGELLQDEIHNTSSVVWANDNQTLFYTILDEVNRPYQVFRHKLRNDPKLDKMIYHEKDEAFYLYPFKTKDEAFIILGIYSMEISEMRYQNANSPESSFKELFPRKNGVEYYIEHFSDKFFIQSNEWGKNFEIFSVSDSNPSKEKREIIIPHRNDAKIEDFEIFKNHLVVRLRENGLQRIQIMNNNSGEEHYVEFDEPTYTLFENDNKEFDTELFRFLYTSLTTPKTIYDYNMNTHSREIKKKQEVPSGYDQSSYILDRIFAPTIDTVLVPISLVYKKGLTLNGKNPMLLYGYGAYGATINPFFSTNRLSLLDRGFVFAIAHIRGGEYLGKDWYDQGKLLNKKNSFYDFIACAEYLVNQKYTSPEKLVIEGGSAGGLLMGAVVNMRPDLFGVVLAHVPWVDILNDMFDKTLPATLLEHKHVGNPEDKQYYDYIKSYSPYDNVVSQNYPSMLVTSGLNDPRVFFWEPTKWVAKLRALKTDNNIILLKTNMESGHFGRTGRYDNLKKRAYELAFILSQLDIDE